VELRAGLEREVGAAVPATAVFDYPSVEALSDYLATILPELAGADGGETDEYEHLTEDDLLQQLSERLGQAN
jgi:phthiocerol/phenolphthiocerol synthesis type-I polyketide synthase B